MNFLGKEILSIFAFHKTDFRKPSFATTTVQPTPTHIFRYTKTREAHIDTACYIHRITKSKFAQ
jgi:hypothetical protein